VGHDKRILVPHYNGRERRVRTTLRDLTTLGDPDDDGYSPPRVEEGVRMDGTIAGHKPTVQPIVRRTMLDGLTANAAYGTSVGALCLSGTCLA